MNKPVSWLKDVRVQAARQLGQEVVPDVSSVWSDPLSV